MFVKICGITSEEDALLAVAMDADAVGFTFAPSIRQVAPIVARDIVKRLPPETISVGVFRDQAPERVVSIVNQAGLRAAQLHGHESAEATRYVAARVPMVIKAFSAGSPELAGAKDHGVEVVLIDGATPGSGQAFDWDLAREAPSGLRTVLAGGLHAGNVAAAIEAVRPWGVDVASGVERDGGTPGEKDPRKVRLFVANARAAAESLPEEAEPYDWTDDTLS